MHTSAWPTVDELPSDGDTSLVADTAAALVLVRGAKSDAKVSMKTPVEAIAVTAPAASIANLRLVADDLSAVGHIECPIDFVEGGESVTADIVLGEPPVKRPRG